MAKIPGFKHWAARLRPGGQVPAADSLGVGRRRLADAWGQPIDFTKTKGRM